MFRDSFVCFNLRARRRQVAHEFDDVTQVLLHFRMLFFIQLIFLQVDFRERKRGDENLII